MSSNWPYNGLENEPDSRGLVPAIHEAVRRKQSKFASTARR